jgi:cupin 2 domain-containing protein
MSINLPYNLFENVRAQDGTEQFESLLELRNVSIERIVSSGSQPATRYVQDHDEWVLLVQGQAEMMVGGQHVSLNAGDTLHLPARVPHEVLSTSEQSLWLAVHVR